MSHANFFSYIEIVVPQLSQKKKTVLGRLELLDIDRISCRFPRLTEVFDLSYSEDPS